MTSSLTTAAAAFRAFEARACTVQRQIALKPLIRRLTCIWCHKWRPEVVSFTDAGDIEASHPKLRCRLRDCNSSLCCGNHVSRSIVSKGWHGSKEKFNNVLVERGAVALWCPVAQPFAQQARMVRRDPRLAGRENYAWGPCWVPCWPFLSMHS